MRECFKQKMFIQRAEWLILRTAHFICLFSFSSYSFLVDAVGKVRNREDSTKNICRYTTLVNNISNILVERYNCNGKYLFNFCSYMYCAIVLRRQCNGLCVMIWRRWNIETNWPFQTHVCSLILKTAVMFPWYASTSRCTQHKASRIYNNEMWLRTAQCAMQAALPLWCTTTPFFFILEKTDLFSRHHNSGLRSVAALGIKS